MRHNFTLIEILGVTLLIAILAALGIAGYSYAAESSRESATKALIARMKLALEDMRREGKLHRTNGFVTVTLRLDNPTAANRLAFGTDNVSDGYDIFVKAVSADTMKRHLNAQHQIVDGWRNPIYVRYPGRFNRGGFDIISPGSDGRFGDNGTDNDPPKDNTKYRTADGEWNCDDVANF